MTTLNLSPVITNTFDDVDQQAILDYLNRQAETHGEDFLTNQYFAVRASNGLKKFKRIDVFVNAYSKILLFEIQE